MMQAPTGGACLLHRDSYLLDIFSVHSGARRDVGWRRCERFERRRGQIRCYTVALDTVWYPIASHLVRAARCENNRRSVSLCEKI